MLALLIKLGIKLGLGSGVRFLTSPTGFVVMLVAAFGAWTWWNRYDAAHDVRVEIKVEHLEEFQKTMERIDANPTITDPDVARKRLCELRGDPDLTDCGVSGDQD